ncbi:MAG: hypothetical protein WDW36_001327 [Sanguina aurantia]
MLPLRCQAQNYEWGRRAAESEVAQLAKANGSEIDESKLYAELWMGTHPNCPSRVAATGQSLQEWISGNPSVLGDKVSRYFKGQLPFLFKVLSVNKALSIQSHPDKELAQRLHASHPKMYADDNHKPEMALALGGFEALCSFVAVPELQEALRSTPELRAVVGERAAAEVEGLSGQNKEVLQSAFTALMTAEPGLVKSQCAALISRLQAKADSPDGGGGRTARDSLVLRLHSQYEGDVGVLSSYFLNMVTLEPGQAIFLAANEPHAYVAGELMEVMATSDNVIRAGLTPKFRHTDVLCASLTYEQGFPEVLPGSASGVPGTTVYRPPFEEFELQRVAVAPGSVVSLPANQGPMILLVQHGSGSAVCSSAHTPAGGSESIGLIQDPVVRRGGIFFVPAGTCVTMTAEESLTVWAAACNSNFFLLQEIRDSAAREAEAAELVPA